MAERADTVHPHIDKSPPAAQTIAATALIVAAVALIYHDAPASYFFNDDVQWMAAASRFDLRHLVHIGDYHHFYRPLVELYFFVGRLAFACRPAPFHLASIGLHLLTTFALFVLVRELTSRSDTAYLAALFFAVQPGLVEAVVWIGAVTDLLPALWYILTLWRYARFLRRQRAIDYAACLVTFVLCLLTHEVAATLLPVMAALHVAIAPRRRAIGPYVPFAALLGASLAISYLVNRRSYLVVEGHWRIGWHAVPNALRYLVTLPVWTAGTIPYVVTSVAIVVVVAVGSARARFAVFWMLAALAPATFFTWDNVSRYLYLPSAAFSLLLADGLIASLDPLQRRVGRRIARALVVIAAAALALRFAMFAERDADTIADRTQAYQRFADALRRSSPTASAGAVVRIDAADLNSVPALYRQDAAGVVYCTEDVRVAER